MTFNSNVEKTNGVSKLDNRTVPPLGMTGPQFVENATQVINEIEQYYSNISDRPVLPSIEPGYLAKLLPESPPQEGQLWPEIQKDIERTIMPGITHWQHPKFMAFFSASSTYPGILAEMWSAALTAPAFNWICSPAVTELETIVLDWMAQVLALPQAFHSKGTGGGVIQGSASEAIVTVMTAARERYVRRQIEREGITDPEQIEDRSCEIRGKLVAMASDQTHSSSQKAATIAGTRFRSIPTKHKDAYALQGHQLRRKIEELESKGLKPYYITVSIGATGVCAVDDFDSIREVASDYPDIWIHVDAAYAGAAMVLPEYHHLSQKISFVDSFNFNMHKWLLTNFDASVLYVQKRRDLTDALSITPAYLRNEFTEKGLVTDYRDWQIPLGRRFRALKIWFVVRTYGVKGLQEHIRHHINLGNLFADLVRSREDLFSILAPPAFALTVLTVNPRVWQKISAAKSTTNGIVDPRPYEESQTTNVKAEAEADDPILKAANDVTKEVFGIIDEKKEFFLTSTLVGGVYAIRVVSSNPLAEEKYVREVFDELVRTTEHVLAGHRA
ncbi:Aromatic-L-amino-acid decarboxylase [Pseudocercospora fuligena]|uniref:Aromatic-L-amino-acid decarboxylase n=1 Tax=Pseudocercospora fuligena TaxID=685502 RepID=A0A8H6VJR3_9PEZI|nr:Aromatic-L-amino-acid decarboxylase [Pseudocercospora fuligena]